MASSPNSNNSHDTRTTSQRAHALDKFTSGLPNTMYQELYGRQYPPRTFEEWRQEAIQHHKKWTHFQGRLDAHRTKTNPRPTNNNWRRASKYHTTPTRWIRHPEELGLESQRKKTSSPEGIGGRKQWPIRQTKEINTAGTSGKSPASVAIRKGITLVIADRNLKSKQNASGSRALAQAKYDKQR